MEAEWWAAWGPEAEGDAGVQGKRRDCAPVLQMRPRDSRGPQRTLPFDCRQRETRSSSSGSGDCEEKCYHALSTLFWTTCWCFSSASSPQPCRKGITSPFDRRRNRFRERKHLAQRHTAGTWQMQIQLYLQSPFLAPSLYATSWGPRGDMPAWREHRTGPAGWHQGLSGHH